jgi:hypothetical protein
MSKFEKVLIILLMGSLWGALELFGADLMRALGIPNKSAVLFGLGLIILFASKRLVDFAGSVAIMALIAGLFKTASSSFYGCQFAAVMINGIVFDGSYRVFKSYLNSSPIYRAISGPVIAYVSYAVFGFFVTYIMQEPNWAANGFKGIIDYLTGSALYAALISLVTINLGYYLGNVLRAFVPPGKIKIPAVYFQAISIVIVAAIWIAGQIY